jgi:uncharacterized protein DUF1937
MEYLKQFDLVYLATPYSKYPKGIDCAFGEACVITGKLLLAGVNAYSPIVHMHPVAVNCRIDPLDYRIWIPANEALIKKADALLIATMPTWELSYGISLEFKRFSNAGKPIFYICPETLAIESCDDN